MSPAGAIAAIGLTVDSFARTGAAISMTVEDVYTHNRPPLARLRETAGRRHAMPCHHNLEEDLIKCVAALGAGSR